MTRQNLVFVFTDARQSSQTNSLDSFDFAMRPIEPDVTSYYAAQLLLNSTAGPLASVCTFMSTNYS